MNNCKCHVGPEWSGRPNPENPDNEWLCDECGRAVPASAAIGTAVEPRLGALLRELVMVATELLNALRPFANIATDAALMADVLHGMRPHEAASLREALKTARLLVERHGNESDSECG